MVRKHRTFWMLRVWGMSACGLILAGPRNANAQLERSIPPASTTDSYGNARSTYTQRRPVGSFQNEWQQAMSRGYQDFGRRLDRRGGFSLFSLPGDYQRQRLDRLQNPGATAQAILFGHTQEIAQKKYGGFSHRSAAPRTADLTTSLRRRDALITASSLNAPVHRALRMTPGSGTMNSAMGQTPFLKPFDPLEASSQPTVQQQLHLGVEVAHDRIRREAWDWFRMGQYRRAARAFDAAVQIDSTDTRSRIGEFFSYLSLGSIRTAQVVLRSLNRQTTDPFLFDLNIPDSFRDAKELQRVRTQVALLAGPVIKNPQQHAMQALALWYMGAYDEARTLVERIVHETQDQRYTLWLGHMRTATSKSQSNEPSP